MLVFYLILMIYHAYMIQKTPAVAASVFY